MARTGLGTALNSVGLTNNIVAPRSYNGQEEYEKSLVTDKGARTRQIIKDGLADILSFGMGALTNLYSPLGLAAGASAVANRHSAMNAARTNYENALNNNLARYDYLTNSVGVPMPFSRNEVTGNTDFSPYENKVLLDQVAANETAKRMNDIYKSGENLTAGTYNKYGYNSDGTTQIHDGSLSGVPTVQGANTTPKTNALPNVPQTNNNGIQPLKLIKDNTTENIENVSNGYGSSNGQTPTLQGNVQQTSQPYLIDPDLFKTYYTSGVTNTKNARDEKYDYYNTNLDDTYRNKKMAQDYEIAQQDNAIKMYKATHPTTQGSGRPNQRIMSNYMMAIGDIDNLIGQLDALDKLIDDNPNATGLWQGTGAKSGKDWLKNITNANSSEGEIGTRAAISKMRGTQMHDLIGGAQTAIEQANLAPFIPDVTDNERTVKAKIKQAKKEANRQKSQYLNQANIYGLDLPYYQTTQQNSSNNDPLGIRSSNNDPLGIRSSNNDPLGIR